MNDIKQYDDEEIKYSVVKETIEPEIIKDDEKKEIVREISMEYSEDSTTVKQKVVDKEIKE